MDLEDLITQHGSAKRPDRSSVHPRPDDVSVDLVAAIGKLSAALETAEVARGHLYDFHRYSGTADREVQEAAEALRAAGRQDIATVVDEVLVGRDVVDGLWSFQIVERYDKQYWQVFRDTADAARNAAELSEPHVYEAGLKEQEQSG